MFRRDSNRTKMKYRQSHCMFGVIREVFLAVISLLVLFSTVFAEDASTRLAISTKSDDKIEGYTIDVSKTKDAQKPSVRFSAVNGRADEIIDINLLLNDKQINVRIGYGSREGDFHISAYDSHNPVAMLTEEDNVLVNKALHVVASGLRGQTLVEDKLVRTLNLMDSWPSNLPLNILEIVNLATRSETPQFLPWCGFSFSLFTGSDNLCSVFSKTDLTQDATYTKVGGNICSIPPYLIAILVNVGYVSGGVSNIAAILNTVFQPPSDANDTITEATLFGGDKCMGRCGKGCIPASIWDLDSIPNRGVNIYTQACLDHDVCVGKEKYSYFDARCNWMFLFVIKDFISGPTCDFAPTLVYPLKDNNIPANGTSTKITFQWKTNFPGATKYYLTITSKGQLTVDVKDSCTSNGTGGWESSCSYEVDNFAQGKYSWNVLPIYANGTVGELSSTYTFNVVGTVSPVIEQSPMSGPPGTTFVQSGTGFTPNSTATLHIVKPDETEYQPAPQQAIDSNGTFSITYSTFAAKNYA